MIFTVTAKKTVKKWTYIRDTYLKSEKKIEGQKMSGSGAKTAKPYVYHKQLSFLKKTAQTNKTVSSISESETTAETIEEDCADEDASSMHSSDSLNKQPLQLNKPLPKRPSTSKLSPVDAKMIKFMDSFPSQAVTINRHISFFNGLIPTLDKFDEDQVIEFQLGVLKLIKGIKNSITTQRQMASGSQDCSPYFTGNYTRNYGDNTGYFTRNSGDHTSGIPSTSYPYCPNTSPASITSQDSLLSNSYSDDGNIDYTTF